MKKFFLATFLFLMSCASPAAFFGEGLFSLGITQSAQKAALSTATDYVVKEKTGKNKVELISSKVLQKDCVQEKLSLNCK